MFCSEFFRIHNLGTAHRPFLTYGSYWAELPHRKHRFSIAVEDASLLVLLQSLFASHTERRY